jgi:predicted TIM-barrel fold metal-dependent hydrolase
MSDNKMISCDDHLDLGYLPADLWTSRMAASLGERAPHVAERGGDAVWVCDGKVWGGWRGRPRQDGRPKPKGPVITALDRGGLEESERRPAIPALRLADMDRDGVEAHVMYGPVFSIQTEDPALRAQCYRVYNDWLAEFCAAAPERLVGVPMLPEMPAAALSELEQLAAKGWCRQVNLQIANVRPGLDDASWEPLWRTLEETGLILSFHVTVFAPRPGDPAAGTPAGGFAATKSFLEQFLEPFVDLFAWGILERHPKLRIVMAESGLVGCPGSCKSSTIAMSGSGRPRTSGTRRAASRSRSGRASSSSARSTPPSRTIRWRSRCCRSSVRGMCSGRPTIRIPTAPGPTRALSSSVRCATSHRSSAGSSRTTTR